VHILEKETVREEYVNLSLMARSRKGLYGSRVNFTSRQRNCRVTVNERHAITITFKWY
jgi:hypothetical protein